jgi:diguanylate cyclase (GGDEF)-like protein
MDSIFGEIALLPFRSAYQSDPRLLWLHVLSESGIALAYLSFPVLLVLFLRQRRDTPYLGLFRMFALFSALGGATHVVAILEIWRPIYWAEGMLQAMAAVVSIATVVMLAQVLPKIVRRSSPIADTLTALPNRLLFVDRVGLATSRIKRQNRDMFAVLSVDIDRFKRVNDTLGHDFGNKLLIRVARRLHRAVRPVDTVARFGGDAFIVLLERVDGPLYAKNAALRMISELQRPFPFGDVEVKISACIGIVVSDGTAGAEELIRAADEAMYRAKARGRGAIELYDERRLSVPQGIAN